MPCARIYNFRFKTCLLALHITEKENCLPCINVCTGLELHNWRRGLTTLKYWFQPLAIQHAGPSIGFFGDHWTKPTFLCTSGMMKGRQLSACAGWEEALMGLNSATSALSLPASPPGGS